MKITNHDYIQSNEDWHVLVLHDGDEKDIKGIWGPYASTVLAETALQELSDWPIDGHWTIYTCKRFPNRPPVTTPIVTYRDGTLAGGTITTSTGIQVGNRGSQTNTYG